MLTAYLLETPGIQHPPGILELLSYSNFPIGITCYHIPQNQGRGSRVHAQPSQEATLPRLR